MRSVKGASASASEPRYISPSPPADRQRAVAARADHQVALAGEHEGEGEGPGQPRQRAGHGGDRIEAVLEVVRDQMDDDLAIGVGNEAVAARAQLAGAAHGSSR